MERFIVTIEGPGFQDHQEVELHGLPETGDALETKLGTCIVTSTEPSPAEGQYAGRIVCSLA